jgi:hypothetical protein
LRNNRTAITYRYTFWYISAQFVTLPKSMRRCIRSQESVAMPCQGASMSLRRNDKLGGILRLQVSASRFSLLLSTSYARIGLYERDVQSLNFCVRIFATVFPSVHFLTCASERPIALRRCPIAYSAISIAQIPVPQPKSSIRGPS